MKWAWKTYIEHGNNKPAIAIAVTGNADPLVCSQKNERI